jgi:hypothetical protein
MTSRELLRLVFRRWYLMVLGAVLSVAVLGFVYKQPGVYWTQFDVVVLAPQTKLQPNNIEDPKFAMAPMAGVVVTEANGGKRPSLLASSDTSLYGEGLRQASRARLPNNGSQWLPIYSKPNIDVQVVDPDPAVVEQKSRQITAELSRILLENQDRIGVKPRARMSMIASPADPVVAHITGSLVRAAFGTALLGATLTTFAVYGLERWRLRRRARLVRA